MSLAPVMPARRPHLPALRRRLTALVAVVLVLVLDVLAVTPAAHAWLHGKTSGAACTCSDHRDSAAPAAGDAEDGCIVSVFAQGKVGEGPAVFQMEAPGEQRNDPVTAPPALRLATVAHRYPPGCGPPAA